MAAVVKPHMTDIQTLHSGGSRGDASSKEEGEKIIIRSLSYSIFSI